MLLFPAHSWSQDDYFAVSDREIFLNEGEEIKLMGEARGAQKISWIRVKDGREEVIAEDTGELLLNSGRVNGKKEELIIFRADFSDGYRIIKIPLHIYETIPEPVFSLTAPVKWNGREPIEIVPEITNLEQLSDNQADQLNYKWEITNIAVLHTIDDGKLILNRALNSGLAVITLYLDNGGLPVSQTIAVKVEEPLKDDWLDSGFEEQELPEDNQFYARDNDGMGMVRVRGRIREMTDSVMLKVFSGDILFKEYRQEAGKRNSFSFEAGIEAGMSKYRIELWAIKPREEKLVYTARDILCGDVYLITGGSQALATNRGELIHSLSSPLIRSYGTALPERLRKSTPGWGRAVSYEPEKGLCQIGYLGMELAKNILANQEIPVCIINGAVEDAGISMHLRNDREPDDQKTNYGRLLHRVRSAGLDYGVRGIIWLGDDIYSGNTSDWDSNYNEYLDSFIELAADWTEDYPNVRNLYMFQSVPGACSRAWLREAQRKLLDYFSNLEIVPAVGIETDEKCMINEEGYRKMAGLLLPLIERDVYKKDHGREVSPPDLADAYYTNQRRDEIALEFNQPMDWDKNLEDDFFLDGQRGIVEYGSLWGNRILLKLKESSEAENISYISDELWDHESILYGRNGLPALTFFDVPLKSTNGRSHDESFMLERSPAKQPYTYISSGSFSGKPVHESPDPLVSYRWPGPQAEDELEIFTMKPVNADTDQPGSFFNISSLCENKTNVTVRGEGSIRIDFGTEMPAWIEFDSPDCPGGVEMSISEYNEPGINKTGKPVRYGNTYRLELNDELYDGVRFAWIHVREHTGDWHINDVRAVNQVKPANYNGSFSCSDQVLTRAWYMSAYSVRAAMVKDYFGAILMDRGDRMSWTGDAHPIQAASLVAFGNYDFIKKNIENTADQNNGIRSYSLYWVLSLIDYYRYTGDREFLEKYLNNAANKLDDAYLEYGKDPDLRFYGWDERLTAGFELWFKPAPEAQKAYKMLTIRAWLEFAGLMREIGRSDLDSKYTWWARRKIGELRQDQFWVMDLGMHAASDAINTGMLNQREIDSIYINQFISRSRRLSLSPFNQYFVIQALGNIGKYDDALSTIRDIWGGMLKQGGTTPYEVFRPSWNDFLEPNDPVPNSQSGIVSLCHPWGAGPVKWLNEEILGIKPLSPGFKEWVAAPNPGKRLEWIRGSTPTPHGEISVDLDVNEGSMFIKAPYGAKGKIGVPRMGRFLTSIIVNGELAWDGLFHEVDGIGGSSFDEDFVYLDDVEPVEYDISYSFTGSTSFYVEPHYQFMADFIGVDDTTRGGWEGKYGKDGFVLCNYLGNGADFQNLPEYVDSVEYFRAFPRTPENKPESIVWVDSTMDNRALAFPGQDTVPAVASAYASTGETMTFTVNLNREKDYQVALYFLDWDHGDIRQAVEMFDAGTLELISPVKMVSYFQEGKYLIFNYDKSVKFRINNIRGDIMSISGIFFDPQVKSK